MQIIIRGADKRKVRQLTTAAVIVLIVHGLIFWGLALMRPEGLNLSQPDYSQRLPIELWQIPAKPVPVAQTAPRHASAMALSPAELSAPVHAPEAAPTQSSADSSAPTTHSDAPARLFQAMQAHAHCISLQKAGKPMPSACHMADLASQANLGPRPDERLQAAVVQKDYELQYKTTPGNSDYWKRVAGIPTDSDLHHCSAEPGTYSNAKDQRVMRCWAPDPKNGYGVH